MKTVPIVLFVYKRPGHTRRCLETLCRNKESGSSELFVFADGPKTNAAKEDITAIEETRQVITEKQWCGKVHLHAAEQNKGLAASVTTGVSEIINRFGKAIVLEDDVELSPYFLEFMNTALAKYENEERVAGIGGWNYYCPPARLSDNFFFRLPDSVAWGTYERSWKLYEPSIETLLQQVKNRNLIDTLTFNGAVDLYTMLQQQQKNKIDSWAVKWTATNIINEKLTFYPRVSLAKHTGYGDASTHTKSTYDPYNYRLKTATQPLPVQDTPIEENPDAVACYRSFYLRQNNRLYTIANKIRQKLRI